MKDAESDETFSRFMLLFLMIMMVWDGIDINTLKHEIRVLKEQVNAKGS